MTTTANTRAADAARQDTNLDGWLEFKRSLGERETVENILALATDPLAREMLSGTELGFSLYRWIFEELLPELATRGVYEADENDEAFQIARIVISLNSPEASPPMPMH